MTREEHLQWCKYRAIKYIESGDVSNGLTAMFSDLTKHPETENHAGIHLGVSLMFIGALSDAESARRFIDGFR